MSYNILMEKLEDSDKLSGDALKYTIGEIQELNRQIHEYYRLTPQTMTVIAIVAGSVAATFAINSDLLKHGIFLAAPVILAVAIVYHFNVATEAGARMEHMDRLSARVNRSLGTKVFVAHHISKLLKFSMGTMIMGALVGCILVSIAAVGPIYAWNTQWFYFQLFSSTLSLVAVIVAFIGISSTRRKANAVLDEIFGDEDRPAHAPLPKDGLWAGFRGKSKR